MEKEKVLCLCPLDPHDPLKGGTTNFPAFLSVLDLFPKKERLSPVSIEDCASNCLMTVSKKFSTFPKKKVFRSARIQDGASCRVKQVHRRSKQAFVKFPKNQRFKKNYGQPDGTQGGTQTS